MEPGIFYVLGVEHKRVAAQLDVLRVIPVFLWKVPVQA